MRSELTISVHFPVPDVHVNKRDTHGSSCQMEQSFPDVLKTDLHRTKAANPVVPSLPDHIIILNLC